MPDPEQRPIHPLERKPAHEPDYTQLTPPPPVPMSERLAQMSRMWAVWVLILINLAVFFSGGITDQAINQRAYVGGNSPFFVRENGEVWRLLTAMFLHGSIAHVGLNMLTLYSIGSVVETLFGHRRFLMVYFASGLGGSLMSVLLGSYYGTSVGASGAIFGLFGVLIVFFYRYRSRLTDGGREFWRSLIFSAVMVLAVGFIPGSIIDNWGHLGGLLVGAGLAWGMNPSQSVRAPYPTNDL